MKRTKEQEIEHINSLLPGDLTLSKIFDSGEADDDYELKVDDENIKFEVIEQYGGEGQGEEYWAVWKLIDKNNNEEFYIRFNAYHNSWVGVECSDFQLVTPKKVEVTKFFEKEFK